MSQVTKHLDYITVSAKNNRALMDAFRDPLPGLEITEDCAPLRFYDTGYRLACGGMLCTSRDARQGGLVQLSGVPLDLLRAKNGGTDDMLIGWLNVCGADMRATRIDYAVTVYTSERPAYHDASQFESAPLESRSRLNLRYEDVTARAVGHSGLSLYFGSAASDLRLVVYDKAHEQCLAPPVSATRVELRARGDNASALFFDCRVHGVQRAGDAWLASKFQFTLSWWERVIETPIQPSKAGARADAKWQKWIEETVLPSFEKHRTEQAFIRRMLCELGKLVD